MCDYSVVAKGQRDVRAGENLVVTQFGQHTRGFASPGDRNTAVCLFEGAAVGFANLPQEIRKRLDLPTTGTVNSVFVKADSPSGHRDALMFENGRTLMINDLPLGLAAVAMRSQAGRRMTAAAIPQRATERAGVTMNA